MHKNLESRRSSMSHLACVLCCFALAACTTSGFNKPAGTTAFAAEGCECIRRGSVLADIAGRLEDQQIMYSQTKPKSDCPGIFHRVLDGLSERCRCFSAPSYRDYRTTRQLALWYFEQGVLVQVRDPLEDSEMIEIGTVMFYGIRGRTYRDVAVADLFRRGSGIEHMGVVVGIERDERGKLRSYSLFHGRTYGEVAAATNHHTREMGFGNDEQPWVAVARVVP